MSTLSTTEELVDDELSHACLHRLAGEGFARAEERICSTAGIASSWEAAAMLACVTSPGGAVISHRSAAFAWRLDVPPADDIHVTCPETAGEPIPRAGVVLHPTNYLPSCDRTIVGRLPATTVARTLADLADELSFGALMRAVDDALARRLVTPARLADTASSVLSHGGRGMHVLRSIVSRWPDGERLGSLASSAFVAAVSAARLPAPEHDAAISNGRRTVAVVDYAWTPQRVALEIEESRAAPSIRARILTDLGWTVLTAPRQDLESRTWSVLAALAPRLR
jgi:hypothetical protein